MWRHYAKSPGRHKPTIQTRHIMGKSFIHRHAAHCESGAISALLRDRGLDLSEPIVFGIGSGIFFMYMPFIKMGGIPLTAYRAAPGAIIKNACKRLGIAIHTMRFRNPEKGMTELDHLMEQGISVGLQTSVFWLPYFPRDMRFIILLIAGSPRPQAHAGPTSARSPIT